MFGVWKCAGCNSSTGSDEYGNGSSNDVVLACPLAYDAQPGIAPQYVTVDAWGNGCISGVSTLKVDVCKAGQSGGNASCNAGVVESPCTAAVKHPVVAVPFLVPGGGDEGNARQAKTSCRQRQVAELFDVQAGVDPECEDQQSEEEAQVRLLNLKRIQQ